MTAAVILDPAPPGGGTELLHAGPDGLYLECTDVRGCISAEGPATYDPATGVVGVQLSAAAGNTTMLGTDGGLFTPASAGTALQAADTTTVDSTVTGTGTVGDPYTVEADVIVAPSPNGLAAGPNGLVVAPSADAGNQLEFGADGRLFVPPDPPLTVGCGLRGAGTAASPLAAFPVAGARDWTTDWGCDPAANSTLHCDPTSGALWTPPEHTSAAVSVQQEHFLNGPVTYASPLAWQLADAQFFFTTTYTADSLTTCRGVTFTVEWKGHVDLSWTAGTTFELGYAVDVGGGPFIRQGVARFTTGQPADHQRLNLGFNKATVLPPHTGGSVKAYPALRVMTGSITINSWLSDYMLTAITR